MLTKVSRIIVVVPVSAIWMAPHLREKTLRVANLLRAINIFKVKELIFFSDSGRTAEQELLTLSRYLETPPYLRKTFPLSSTLKYAGVAPPIKGPLHTVANTLVEALNEPMRLGVTASSNISGETLVNVGLGDSFPFFSESRRRAGEEVLVHLERQPRRGVVAKEINWSKVPYYTGPRIKCVTPSEHVASFSLRDGFRMELSRSGAPLPEILLPEYPSDILVFTGNQNRDPHEFMEIGFDASANLVPDQGVETIRSDEACMIALSQLAWLR